jgi:hypothetical protein
MESFRENQCLTDPERIQAAFDLGLKNLEVMRRQAAIGRMYEHQKSVIETKEEMERQLRSKK